MIRGKLLHFNKPLTMGIINITADSFYAGSRTPDTDSVLRRAEGMLRDGADLLDLGACSTRPGAAQVSPQDERQALLPAITAVAERFPEAIISADTYRAHIAEAAVQAGAHLINDVGSGILDPEMWPTIARLRVPYILMHNRDTPERMQQQATYTNVVNDVLLELSQKINALHLLGVADIIADPGFGFAKSVAHNFELLRRFDELHLLGVPLLAGLSRKSMVWRTLGSSPDAALNGTTALHMAALERGARILRVHDVREAREAIVLYQAMQGQ